MYFYIIILSHISLCESYIPSGITVVPSGMMENPKKEWKIIIGKF